MAKITFTDKIDARTNGLDQKYKVIAADMNEIKTVVNGLDDLIIGLTSSKQDTLVSGTNIKTINSGSLLGSGNIDLQEVLVSGTNIKTLNGTSLLGSGNISITSSNVSNSNLVSNGVYTFDINTNVWKIVNGANTILDVQPDGRVGYAGDYLSTAMHVFRNPLGLGTIAEFQHQNGIESVLINTNGTISTYNTSGTLIHRLRNQSGVGYLEGWNSSGVQYMSFQSGDNGYYAKRININSSSAANSKAVMQLNQNSANISQQLFFANITTSTAGRTGSSGTFGAAEKGLEVFDTDIDRKFIWNGIDFSRIATYDEILSNSWISATETILEASFAGLTAYTYDVTVAGVSVGDFCVAVMDEDVQAAITAANAQDHTRAYCAVAGTVRVILMVSSFITVPASSVFKVRVFK